MPILKRVFPVLFFGGILGLVIWQIVPPKSFDIASYFQIIVFWVPLFLLLFFILNLFIRFFLRSFIITLGIILLLVIKTLDIFNILTVILTILSIIFLVKTFKKPRRKFYRGKIPKISKLAKQR
ncbi:hypothetical protein A2617_01515 [Candidatus Daviesbacteria bacterium RIFOXYD1_FULL_41_10]|uniref:Uncharacterized protein n=2 Tax=Candidatus Daviesiibacteriota TaxID=1752718 RepID=A0A1F5MZF8_9BACT|nr:MAG: hypothetical protein UU67_C0022G0004 [Candidatus Daviesbacteria bacterium GW2011_GWB1_41_5]OGE70745.1 MAG: hypothetical protein A2617_01515 [Candidatus Daviesbacteria bacterium RIFOXYD1_FULL_41_10]HBR20185.1 hypothetical protein [Phycisphaerales bacterium]